MVENAANKQYFVHTERTSIDTTQFRGITNSPTSKRAVGVEFSICIVIVYTMYTKPHTQNESHTLLIPSYNFSLLVLFFFKKKKKMAHSLCGSTHSIQSVRANGMRCCGCEIFFQRFPGYLFDELMRFSRQPVRQSFYLFFAPCGTPLSLYLSLYFFV